MPDRGAPNDEESILLDEVSFGNGTQRPDARRWSRRQWAVVLTVSLALTAGTVASVTALRGHEFTKLATCVRSAESALAGADRRMSAMGAYVEPSLSNDIPAATRLGLDALIGNAVKPALAGVSAALHSCLATPAFLSSPSFRDSRSTYLTYLRAEAAYVESVTTDGALAFSQPPALSELRQRAEQALLRIAPDSSAAAVVRATFAQP